MKIGWRSAAIGLAPYQVTAIEVVDRGGVIYLRWRAQTARGERNWRYKVPLMDVVDGGVTCSVPVVLRTAQGRIIQERVRWAEEQARLQFLDVVRSSTGTELPAADGAQASVITVGETETLVCHPHTGLYPKDTRHRREVQRSLRFAVAVWGASRPWASIQRAQLREIGRRKLELLRERGLRGARAAEVVVSHVLSIASWLRDEGLIPATAALAPRHWKAVLLEEAGAPDVQRPRYTPEEYRALLQVAPQADPRLGLLVELGMEYRLGQVCRQRRSDLVLVEEEDAETGATRVVGRFRVKGRGKKRGAVIMLTPDQVANVQHVLTEGYLRDLEAAGGDYPLFPQGQLAGGRLGHGVATEAQRHAGPVSKDTIRAWWRRAEELAGIEHVPGRGWYGGRRVGVDLAKGEGISGDGLQAWGSWSDASTPNQIYAEEEMRHAQEEAMKVRAKVRRGVTA